MQQKHTQYNPTLDLKTYKDEKEDTESKYTG